MDLNESHLFTFEEAFLTLVSMTKVVDFKKVLCGDSGSAVYLKGLLSQSTTNENSVDPICVLDPIVNCAPNLDTSIPTWYIF